MAVEPGAWLARAGSDGRYEQLALDNDLVAIGWGELGDLTALSREALAKRIRSEYPDAGKGEVSNRTGQLGAFLHGFRAGDLVVLPLKTRPMIAIGHIAGDYVYRPGFDVDARHTRPVRWIRGDVPRTAVGQDLLYSLGAFITVCRVSATMLRRAWRRWPRPALIRGMRALIRLKRTRPSRRTRTA